MVMIVRGGTEHSLLTAAASDTRSELWRAAQARLSGEGSATLICNPVNLHIASFSRVSYMDVEDREPVTRVKARRVADDDLDW